MKREAAWADHTTQGTIVRAVDGGEAGESLNVTVYVEYEVDGATYRHREHACVRYVPTGGGIGGHGFSEQTVISCRRGAQVTVCYDPENPKHAYLRDNVLTAEEQTYKRSVVRRSLRVVASVISAFVILVGLGLILVSFMGAGSACATIGGICLVVAVLLLAFVH